MTHQSQWTQPTLAQLKKGFRIHLLAFIAGIPVIWLVWYTTDRSHPWALYPTGGWSVGVLFHYLGVFVFRKSNDN